jgi:hypothetical protein
MAQKSNKTGAAKTKAHPTVGFGVPVTTAPHHFIVSIPRGTRQPVRITEDLGMHAEGEDNQVLDRVFLHRPTWTEIANPVKRLFNQRLKAHNLAISQWKAGENPVDRLLGKELCVLAWAVEDLPLEKVGAALRNWLALRPEERWWLFGMTAAAAGAPEDKGRGWRAALGYALGDTPEKTIRKPRRTGNGNTKKNKDRDAGQLSLFDPDLE